MDINIVRGAILLILIFSFLGLWAWAWSKKRKSTFSDASMLPLEEDNGVIPNNDDPNNEGSSNAEQPMGEGVNHVN